MSLNILGKREKEMNNYVIKKDFIDLKKRYEAGNIDRFEKKIFNYSVQD